MGWILCNSWMRNVVLMFFVIFCFSFAGGVEASDDTGYTTYTSNLPKVSLESTLPSVEQPPVVQTQTVEAEAVYVEETPAMIYSSDS